MSLVNFFVGLIGKHRKTNAPLKNVFDHYFFDLKYYLHKDASIQDFALLLDVSSEKLNKIAEVNYNLSFPSLINEYRYRHCIVEFENPLNENLPIDSIIKLCGYTTNDKFVEFVKERHKNIE
jgi:AraC-like DNA-binding protein